MDIIDPLYQYLKKNKSRNLLMPCTPHKNPLYKHKNNIWNWDSVIKNGNDFGPKFHQAILMKDLIVIDIDSKPLLAKYEELFDVFNTCPKVETTKGAHYYFNRTVECDLAAMYDHSRCFGVGKDEVDFKSICSTGTAGVVVIPPSKGKKWIRPLWNTPLPDFNGKVFDYFFENWGSRRYVEKIKADPTTKTKKHEIIDDIDEDNTFDKVDLSDNDYHEIELLIQCLNPIRSRDFPTWINVCWCLKNIFARYNDPDELFKNLWIEFSKLCPLKFNYDKCVDKWYKTIPRKSGLKIGTLKSWAKEDNNEQYNEIYNNRDNDISEIVKKQIKDMIKKEFHHPPTKISSIILKEYDSDKMIFANINEPYCNLCDEEHDESESFIIINLEEAYEKCRISDKKGNKYTIIGDLKTSLNDILVNQTSPEEAMKHFIRHYAEKDILIKNMNIKDISPKIDNMLGCTFETIGENMICPIHNVIHDTPSNCIFVEFKTAVMAISCMMNPWQMVPDKGIGIPKNIMNLIMGNNINSNNTTINNYIGDSDEIYSDLFNETFPIFDDSELNNLVNISLKGYASDIADLFYYLAGTNFGVSGRDKDIWWTWDLREMRWIESKNKAHRFCDNEMSQKFDRTIEWFRDNTNDDDLRKKRIYKIESIIKRLKDKDQNSILSQAAIIYKDEIRYFEESLDSNENILNFHGDVYDFDILRFRKIIPEDRVTKTVGYSIPEIDIEKKKFIMDFLISIMKDDIQLNYLLIWLASCLDGKNNEEKFHILKGTGRNGKGVLRDLIAETLGSNSRGYYGTIVSSMLTKERPSSDKPVADLLHIKGKRFLAANEPDKNSRINHDFLNFLTGNDPINGRWLNSNDEIHFWPQHSLCILCNDVPKLDAENEAVWERSRILEFPFKFVVNPKNNREKNINKNLKTEIKGLGPQFMLILLDYYKKYKLEGLEPTPEVMQATNQVRDENDPYKEFIDLKLEKTNNNLDRLDQPQLNIKCNEWMNIEHKEIKFKKKSLRECIEKYYGELNTDLRVNSKNGAGWTFIKWKNSL